MTLCFPRKIPLAHWRLRWPLSLVNSESNIWIHLSWPWLDQLFLAFQRRYPSIQYSKSTAQSQQILQHHQSRVCFNTSTFLTSVSRCSPSRANGPGILYPRLPHQQSSCLHERAPVYGSQKADNFKPAEWSESKMYKQECLLWETKSCVTDWRWHHTCDQECI